MENYFPNMEHMLSLRTNIKYGNEQVPGTFVVSWVKGKSKGNFNPEFRQYEVESCGSQNDVIYSVNINNSVLQ